MNINPIGLIESCYPDKFGTPRQPGLVPESRAVIRFNPDVQPELSLQGLEKFSHLWVLFWFHENKTSRYHAKVHPPRLEGETMGLFATRTPHRPNPIGLSLVKIEEIGTNFILVSGVDIVDKTPVLDVKPYLPEVESIPNALTGWTKNIKENSFQINWSEKTLSDLQEAQAYYDNIQLKSLIENTIQLDPRPLVYRGDESNPSPYRDFHAVRIYDLDVHFRFTTTKNVEILHLFQARPEELIHGDKRVHPRENSH